MDTIRALLLQARLRWKDPAANRAHLEEAIDAAEGRFDLAVLPETFTTGFLGDSDLPEEGMDGDTVAWMRGMSDRSGAAIAGSAVIIEDGERYNRMLFVAPGGEVRHYDKRHLFAYGGEDRRYAAGQQRVTVGHDGWRINLQVCYDLRFPAWCRNTDGYDLMLLVANWPQRRIGHWLTLLQARAIENQAWVIGVNRVGADGNGLEYPGRSVVFGPQGEQVADLGSEECSRIVELDLSAVRSTRERFPFLPDADPFRFDPG